MSSWVVPGYTQIRPLARGAAGQVVLAWHDATGTPVAIRYLDRSLRANADALRRIRSDARVVSEVDSPNIVRVYEYVESAAGAAVVMEIVDGVSLRALLGEQGPLEPEAALAVLKGSLVGLSAAHARGVVHGDYRPENVLVDTEGRSRLTDFGLTARASGSVAADLYAAAVAFAECLGGTPGAPVEVEAAPEPLRALLARGLAADPATRPADATAYLVELAAAAAAGYGAGWEDRGREALARRVVAASRAMETPTHASAQPGPSGTDDESTLRARRPVVGIILGIVTVLIAALAVASCLALQPNADPQRRDHARNVKQLDTPGPTDTPGAPSPSSVASVTPGTKPSASPPQPRPSATNPVGLRVTSMRIDQVLIPEGRTRVLSVTVSIRTTTTGRFTLTLHQEGSDDLTVGGADTRNPTNATFPLSGSTSYTRQFDLALTQSECAQANYILVSALTRPAADTGTASATVTDPRC